jgi:hypothetical protein
MRFAELLDRPRLLIAAAVLGQWLTTLIAALRAEHVAIGAIELLNVVVLGPSALVFAYRVAARAGGVALGSWALLVWVAAPWLLRAFTLGSYDTTVQDRVLPLGLGLTTEPGYASGIALFAAVALLAAPMRRSAAAAGVAAGVGILLVPEALVFLVPASAALLADWRRQDLGTFLFAAAPAVLVVSLWRQPVFGELSLDALQGNFGGLREYFFSQRLMQWLPVAGWFAAWVATGATRVGTTLENGELIRVLLPALPAYVLLAAALPLLVPTLATRLGPRARPVEG